jgi:hypothetical protein
VPYALDCHLCMSLCLLAARILHLVCQFAGLCDLPCHALLLFSLHPSFSLS